MALLNIALGKTSITQSSNASVAVGSNFQRLTDDSIATNSYIDMGTSTDGQPVKLTLDLGDVYDVGLIKVWHYYGDSRSYIDSIVEVSEDGVSWVTVFDSKVSGQYTETSNGKTHEFTPIPVRYVRDGIRGSNANASNHWVELQVFYDDPRQNLAFNNVNWSNSGNTIETEWRYLILTDGVKTAVPYVNGGASTDGQPVKITLDLGHSCSVNEIKVWHYFGDSRIYNSNTVEVSVDGEVWDTIFSGSYAESTAGKSHVFPFRDVRYVRDGIMGSNINTGNHWVEIEVWGFDPAPDTKVNLPCIADTWTQTNNVSATAGTSTEMSALYSASYRWMMWMKFDLSLLSGITSIKSAVLKAYYFSGDIPDRIQEVNIHKVLSDWDEVTLSHSIAPSVGPVITTLESPSLSNNGYGWEVADITSLVNEWLLGTPNFGIKAENMGIEQLGSPSSGDWNSKKFYTREYSGGIYAPYIEVTYSSQSAPIRHRLYVQII